MKVNKLQDVLAGSPNLQVRVETSPGVFSTVTGVVWDDRQVVLKLFKSKENNYDATRS